MTEGLCLNFRHGSLTLDGSKARPILSDTLCWDARSLQWRAPASAYRELVLAAKEQGLTLKDEVREFSELDLSLANPIVPRPHQTAALEAWLEAGGRGVVSLPTGGGKTILAVLAMWKIARSTLIVVPTIDLLTQWQRTLSQFFKVPIGMLGGGSRDVRDITVSTYDSAILHMESFGNRFGFLIVDECHHLPAPQYQLIGVGSIAPFRLGLSATVERADGLESFIYETLGPMVYEADIRSMTSGVLAPYSVEKISVSLTREEREEYDKARETYLSFVRSQQINFGSPRGWMNFVARCARVPGGKAAMQAYRRQKKLAQGSEAKLKEVWRLIEKHKLDRVIIFTEDNEFAYRIGRSFILPVLTHQTKPKERKKFLDAFSTGEINVLVTSKVLNEGVDVPEASVGIVVSGSGGVREHVQRLGRILRHRPGKQAVLYELVSRGTSEASLNERRRQHAAYREAESEC